MTLLIGHDPGIMLVPSQREHRSRMLKSLGAGVAILALVIAGPAHAEQAGRAVPAVAADCEARIQKLEASTAEGEERLAEKNAVIEACAKQYRRDRTVVALVKECAKYEEQPVVK